MRQWERKASIIYSGTKWEQAALAAGKAMDNRLNTVVGNLWGDYAESGSFDMTQWLAWFDYEVLIRRGLQDKAAIL
jgi:hypothetical protein